MGKPLKGPGLVGDEFHAVQTWRVEQGRQYSRQISLKTKNEGVVLNRWDIGS